MSTFSTQQANAFFGPGPSIARDPRVQHALAVLATSVDATTEEQIRITEIPAPPFREAARGDYMAKLLDAIGLKVHKDDLGNVIGELPGVTEEIVMITAHLDTVFAPGTSVRARREEGRIYAPGISDNGTGLAALVAVARAVRDASLTTRSTLLFVADVGEEGEGNLRGMRKLVETYRSRLRYVIALDGSAIDYVTTAGLASRRLEITVAGPGGHSWSDFGAPNPIHALARGIAQFVNMQVPLSPRTTFNVGEIQGGTSVNSIPDRASIKVDLRSESDDELGKISSALQAAIKAGVDAEARASRDRAPAAKPLSITTKVMGVRPRGELPDESPLISALRSADEYLGNQSRLERSSTDANIPLSVGIHAIALGAGGQSGGAHSLGEWYDPTKREIGLQRILLTVLQVAGVADATPASGN